MHLRQLLLTIAVLLAAGGLLAAESSGKDGSTMRWRVYCDVGGGVAFRYPYEYQPTDQYKGELMRKEGGARMRMGGALKEVTINGKKVMMLIPEEPKDTGPDLKVFSGVGSELPSGLGDNPALDAVGDAYAGEKLAWQTYDYYKASPTRPFADPKWAPEALVAKIGESKGRCALVVQYGSRYCGLICRGKLSEAQNQAVIDTFEVLSTGAKTAGKMVAPTKDKPLITWREAQFRAGKVLDDQGRIVQAVQTKANPWDKAWEVETPNYHVTGNLSPARLYFLGQYYQALFKAYSAVFLPEQMPPYKFEIHVFAKADEFEECARKWVDPSFSVRGGGGIVGGFFVPSQLSVWCYEESAQFAGGDHFSVEHVSAHECSHQFLHVTCNGSDHVPTWINEGIAVYFEAGVFQNGRFVNRPPMDRIQRLQAEYSQLNSTLVPLDRYLDHHGHIDASSYAEVYAMVHFWVFRRVNGKQEGRQRFADFWKALRKKEDGNDAFERIFMKDMIAAFGSRQAAVAKWKEAHRDYVLKNRDWSDSGP